MISAQILNKLAFPGWVTEYRFHPTRRWRFDFANPERKVAIEIEGGAFIMGRHNRGRSFLNDMVKYNEAVKMGWRVLRYAPEQLKNVYDDLKSFTEA